MTNNNYQTVKTIKMNNLKTKRFELPYEIKTSKNTEEFRENLLKYFLGLEEGTVYVNYGDEYESYNVKVEELNDINDLWRKGISMFGERKQPYLTPKWNLKNDITDWIIEEGKKGRWDVGKTKLMINPTEFFTEKNNYEIIENNSDYVSSDVKKEWWGLENEILCSFLHLVFGRYSGTDFSIGYKN